jgi:hypothetical protein
MSEELHDISTKVKSYKAYKNRICKFFIENNIIFYVLPLPKNRNSFLKTKCCIFFVTGEEIFNSIISDEWQGRFYKTNYCNIKNSYDRIYVNHYNQCDPKRNLIIKYAKANLLFYRLFHENMAEK